MANQLGQAYLLQNEAAKARDMLERSFQSAKAIGHTITAAASSAHLAAALLRLGDFDGALALAQAAHATARQQGYQGTEVQALCVLATVLASAPDDRGHEAEAALETAIEIAKRIEAKPCLAVAERFLATLMAKGDDRTNATP